MTDLRKHLDAIENDPYGPFTRQELHAAMDLLRESEARERELLEACTRTINENLDLADGEVCTLIHLKRAIARATGAQGGEAKR